MSYLTRLLYTSLFCAATSLSISGCETVMHVSQLPVQNLHRNIAKKKFQTEEKSEVYRVYQATVKNLLSNIETALSYFWIEDLETRAHLEKLYNLADGDPLLKLKTEEEIANYKKAQLAHCIDRRDTVWGAVTQLSDSVNELEKLCEKNMPHLKEDKTFQQIKAKTREDLSQKQKEYLSSLETVCNPFQ